MKNGSAVLEDVLAPIFAKAPHLPSGARQGLVGIAPWLALIFGVLGPLGVVSLFNMMPYMMSTFPYAGGMGGSMYLPMMISLAAGGIAAVLDLLAFKPLSARKKSGWNLIYYGALLSVLSTILSFAFGYGSVMGIVTVVIAFWLLFEMRSSYS